VKPNLAGLDAPRPIYDPEDAARRDALAASAFADGANRAAAARKTRLRPLEQAGHNPLS